MLHCIRPEHGPRAPRAAITHGILLSALLALALGTGCSKQELESTPFIAADLSAKVAHQPLVPAVSGWGGDFAAFVNLWSGAFVVDKPLLDAPALGFDWDVGLYYNSSQAAEVTMVGAGWHFSYDIRVAIDVPAPGQITVYWGDGRRDVYTFDGVRWVGPPSLLGTTIEAIGADYRLRTKHGMRYEFDAAGNLVRLVDRNGNTWTFAYDIPGNLVLITDPSGRSLLLDYNGSNRLIQLSGLTAAPIQLAYAGDLMIQVTDAAGNVTDLTYDGQARVTQVRDAEAATIDVTFHPTVDAVMRVTAGAAEREFEYQPFTLTTTVRERLDATRTNVASYTMNAAALVVRVQGPDGVAISGYDPPTFVLTAHTDVNGRTTTRTVDGLGNPTSTTDPTGAMTTATFDPTYSIRVTSTDAAGFTSSRVLDPAGNVIAETNPVGQTVTIGRTAQGLTQTVTTARGLVATFGQDVHGNMTSATDPAGGTVTATFNPRGRPLEITDQMGNTYRFEYNLVDEMTAVVAPRGGRWEMAYTAVGRLKRLTDPVLAIANYAYNGRHQLASWTNALGALTTYERDRAGEILRVVNALGHSETYSRDLMERVVAYSDEDGGMWTLVPAPGDLTEYAAITDPLGITEMRNYTPRYELAGRNWPGGAFCTYVHDARGLLVHAARSAPLQPMVAYDRTHDAAGRLSSETAQHLGRTVIFTRDADGNVTGVSDNLRPAGAVTVSFGPTNLAQQVSVAGPAFSIGIGTSPRLQLASLNHSNGVIAAFAQDADGVLMQINNNGPGLVANYGIDRDLRGYALRVFGTSPAMAMIDHHLLRDLDGRLRDDNLPMLGINVHYDLDAMHNRTLRIAPPGMPDNYALSPANRLLSVVTGPNIRSFIWNPAGYVTQVMQPGSMMSIAYHEDRTYKSIDQNGQLWQFLSGPFGEIVRVTEPSSANIWFAEDRVAGRIWRRAEFAAIAVPPANEYVYAAAPLGEMAEHAAGLPTLWNRPPYTPATVRGILAGPQGPAQVVSSTGTVLSDVYTDSFGKTVAQTGVIRPRVSFQGMDSFTNLDVLLSHPELMARSCYDSRTGTIYVDREWGTQLLKDAEAAAAAATAAQNAEKLAAQLAAQERANASWNRPHYPGTTLPTEPWRDRWRNMRWNDPPQRERFGVPLDEDWPRFLKPPGYWPDLPWPPPDPPRDPIEIDAAVATHGFSLYQLRQLLISIGQQATAGRIP